MTCQEKIITIPDYVLLFFKTFLSISFKTLLFIQWSHLLETNIERINTAKKTIQAFLILFPFQHVNSFITHSPFESINIELEDPEATFSFANSHHPDPKRELTRPPFREPRLPNSNRGSNRGGLVTGKKVAPPRILKASLRHIRCIIQEDAAALHCSKVHS